MSLPMTVNRTCGNQVRSRIQTWIQFVLYALKSFVEILWTAPDHFKLDWVLDSTLICQPCVCLVLGGHWLPRLVWLCHWHCHLTDINNIKETEVSEVSILHLCDKLCLHLSILSLNQLAFQDSLKWSFSAGLQPPTIHQTGPDMQPAMEQLVLQQHFRFLWACPHQRWGHHCNTII